MLFFAERRTSMAHWSVVKVHDDATRCDDSHSNRSIDSPVESLKLLDELIEWSENQLPYVMRKLESYDCCTTCVSEV